MAATLAQASLEASLTGLNDDGRALLFTEARTANTFSDRPVTGEQLREIYERARLSAVWVNRLLPGKQVTPEQESSHPHAGQHRGGLAGDLPGGQRRVPSPAPRQSGAGPC